MADPPGRVNIAFGQPSLLYDCDWTRIDDHPHLVTSYSIDRGRQYELDRTDTGRATVTIADQDGILDPTNADGPYYADGATQIEPLIQIALGRWNPVTDTWYTRYRGFIEDYDYSFDPSQRVNRLTITCVDLFEILSAIQMTPRATGDPPAFGDDPAIVAPDSQGQIVFANEKLDGRVKGVLGDAGIPDDWFVVFTGNVMLSTTVYAPTESIMSVIQEACDGEFPAVSNAYCEGRTGRLAVHGRNARFDPEGTIAAGGPIPDTVWDWHHWHVGDGAAVNAGSGIAHIREFAFNRGLSKIINSAFASPAYILFDHTQLANAEGDDWARTDNADSIAKYGIRSWSAENLITLYDLDGGGTRGHETVDAIVKFTAYYCFNYHTPKNRVTLCGFRTMSPEQPHAAATWNLLSLIEIGDLVSLTVGSPGGGGFTDEGFFVEGIHEQVNPLGADYDDVTLTLDLSPQAYFTDLTMFEPPPTPVGPPIFTEEGPEFYDAAYAHNSPFATGGPYLTALTSGQETAFRTWVTANSVPVDPDEDPSDYDMRGFYKASVIDNTIPDWTGPGSHFPDTYKTPYDTTFSKESKYATSDCPFGWVPNPWSADPGGDGPDDWILVDSRDGQIVFGPPGVGA